MRRPPTPRPIATIAAAALALAGVATAVSGCGVDSGAAGAVPRGKPIKLGAIITLSGPFAQIGESHEAGARLAVAQINAAGGIDGHKLELDVKDEQASTDATVSDVRELLGSGVRLIFGGTTDSDCLAAAPQISNARGVFVGTSCQTNLLQGSKFEPGFFGIAPTNFMLARATAQFAKDRFGAVTGWDNVGPDYEFGHEVWESFQDDLSKLESKPDFRKSVFVPLAETQFGSYITSLLSGLPKDSSQHNGLFLSTFSATTIGLAQQGKAYNLFKRYKAVLNLGGSTPTAEALGAQTPPLYFVYDYFSGAYRNPINSRFVKGFGAANKGADPNSWAYEGYTAVLAFAAAMRQSRSTDPRVVRPAMAGMRFDTPKGRLQFRRSDHLLRTPVTVWGVVGDQSAPGHFKVTARRAIPAETVLPPVQPH